MAIEIMNELMWKPVQIRMTFNTARELAVFVEMINGTETIADAIATSTGGHSTELIESMKSNEISNTIDGMCDAITWKQLRDLVDVKTA